MADLHPTFLRPGDIIVKDRGTEFIGRVVSVYEIEPGEWRVDAVCIAPGARRLVHLYRPDQFRPATAVEVERIERMTAIWEGSDG